MSESMYDEIDEQDIMNASRLIAKILRHTPEEYDLQLTSRGWANMKELRTALRGEFDYKVGDILKNVLETDDKNRFQLISEDSFAFIRATRGHTTEQVDLPSVLPDENELQWFLVQYENRHSNDYIEAESIKDAKFVIENRLHRNVNWNTVTFEPTDKNITWNNVTQNRNSDSLSGDKTPNMIIHQHGEKYLSIERRVNMMGKDKGRYVRSQPDRVKSRLPE